MKGTKRRQITAIEIQEHDRRRRNVFLDGEFAFGIDQEVLAESGFGIGDFLTAQDVRRLLNAERRHQATQKALRLLSVRSRSEKELRTRLEQAGFGEAADSTLRTLRRAGLVDDLQFALSYARSRISTRPCGEFLLRRELREKGIAEETIEAAVAEAYREKDQRQLAYELAGKKKRLLATTEQEKAQRRVADFLLRRGFAWDLVSEIMERWAELPLAVHGEDSV
ncbi:MAG: RecX family transcriptional regulator [candidate division KSB1 bacterium]|nr:RecX family transcriptional regulator [candidate division KSB1 bacterium]